jgi:hypothetical protein
VSANNKAPQQVVGYRYFMGMHFILCLGEGDVSLTEIVVGARAVWGGSLSGGQSDYIDNPSVFGGDKREGGIGGTLLTNSKMAAGARNWPGDSKVRTSVQGGNFTFYDGSYGQGRDHYLVTKIAPGNPEYIPAYRGLASVVLKHLYIGLNPYLRPFWFRVSRRPALWLNGGANNYFSNGECNPANIIAEVITSETYGMGQPRSTLNVGDQEGDTPTHSFITANRTLWNEGFGLALEWTQQMSCEQFLQHVLEHISGVLRLNAAGKYELKLLRKDYSYDNSSLLTLDESSIVEVKEFERVSWGETINEVNVLYSDTAGRTATTTTQNLSNIQIQGAVVSTTRQYPGIYSGSLAARVAQRDLQLFSTPLARVVFTADRTGNLLNIGDPFLLRFARYGINGVVYRAVKISRGSSTDGTVDITATEDIFGLPQSDASYPADRIPRFDPPARPVAPQVKIASLAYAQIATILGDEKAAALNDPDDSYIGAAALRSRGDVLSFDLITSPIGEDAPVKRAVGHFGAGFRLGASLPLEETSVIDLTSITEAYEIDLLGDGHMAYIDEEIVLVKALDRTAQTLTVARGVLDTVPEAHAAGAWMLYFNVFPPAADVDEPVLTGETLDVRVALSDLSGDGASDTLPTYTYVASPRHLMPIAPARLRLNGARVPAVVAGDLAFTWAHRNRLDQTGALTLEQGDPSIQSEAGVTYTLEVRGQDNVVYALQEGLTGTTATVTMADERVARGGALATRVTARLWAVRDGLTSWQRQVVSADRCAAYQDARALGWPSRAPYVIHRPTGALNMTQVASTWGTLPRTWATWRQWGKAIPPHTWAELTSWRDWREWGPAGYAAPVIVMPEERAWVVNVALTAVGSSFRAQVRYRGAGPDWSRWQNAVSNMTITASRFQVRALVYGTPARLTNLITRIS